MPREIIINSKLCRKCDTIKPLDDFYNCKGNNKLGVTSQCKVCVNERNKRNTKVWKEKNKDITAVRNKEYYQKRKAEKQKLDEGNDENIENVI